VGRRRPLARWSSTGLDRVLGQAGSGYNTLLSAIHADAESPSVIILVEHANQ
jgi:hypothetical protein